MHNGGGDPLAEEREQPGCEKAGSKDWGHATWFLGGQFLHLLKPLPVTVSLGQPMLL